MNRPRILVVIRWPVGGIRTWCRYVYQDPVFEKFDITLFLPDDPEARTLRDELSDSAVNVIVARGIESTARYFWAAIKRTLIGQFDLVHSHGFTSAVASSPACAVRGTSHLVTPHDVVLEHQYRDVKGRILRLLVASALRLADGVQAVGVASSDNLRLAFPRTLKDPQKLTVVRNGIETSRFLVAEPEEVRDRFNIPKDAVLVGFFGRFMAQKGFQYLVEAIRQYRNRTDKNAPMVVLAVGSGGFQREEEQAIKSCGLDDAFRFTGFVPSIAGLLTAVDVVAMPSLWEACPLLPMEALTAGVPIVVSDCRACVELAEGSPARVVPMRDPAALLNAILEMSTPESKAAFRLYKGIAANRFDIAGTRQGIANLYYSLTDQRARRGSGVRNSF